MEDHHYVGCGVDPVVGGADPSGDALGDVIDLKEALRCTVQDPAEKKDEGGIDAAVDSLLRMADAAMDDSVSWRSHASPALPTLSFRDLAGDSRKVAPNLQSYFRLLVGEEDFRFCCRCGIVHMQALDDTDSIILRDAELRTAEVDGVVLVLRESIFLLQQPPGAATFQDQPVFPPLGAWARSELDHCVISYGSCALHLVFTDPKSSRTRHESRYNILTRDPSMTRKLANELVHVAGAPLSLSVPLRGTLRVKMDGPVRLDAAAGEVVVACFSGWRVMEEGALLPRTLCVTTTRVHLGVEDHITWPRQRGPAFQSMDSKPLANLTEVLVEPDGGASWTAVGLYVIFSEEDGASTWHLKMSSSSTVELAVHQLALSASSVAKD